MNMTTRSYGAGVFAIAGFLTPQECAHFIATSEANGYSEAAVRTDDGVSLSLYLMGFRRPLSAYELEAAGGRLRDAACEVATSARGRSNDDAKLEPNGSIW